MKFANYTEFNRDKKKHGVEYAVKRTKELGFDSVEWFESSHLKHLEDVDTSVKILKHYEISMACYSVLASLFDAVPSELEEHMKIHAEAAAKLGSKYLHHTVFPPVNMIEVKNSFNEVFDSVVDVAERVAKNCNAHGLICLYEPQGVYFNGVEGLGKFFEEMVRRGCKVGICGDFGNPFFVDVDSTRVFKTFAKEIEHIHVKDYLVTDTEFPADKIYKSLSGKNIYEAELGKGTVDLAYGFREMSKVGYNGSVSFEFGGNDEELKEKLKYIKGIIEESTLDPYLAFEG